MPWSIAFFEHSSAATCAAKGVDLRDPLKPWAPAVAQHSVFPDTSVMVIIVLLNVEWMCAMPDWTFFLTFFREPFFTVASLLLHRRLFPAGDRLARTLAGSRVRVGPLPTNGQAAAMSQAAVTGDVAQP